MFIKIREYANDACHRDRIFSKIGLELTRSWPPIAPIFFFFLKEIFCRLCMEKDRCTQVRTVLMR